MKKLNLKLEDMNYTEDAFTGPYGNTIIHNEYEHTFKSGHRLAVYTSANGNFWMGSFTAPTGKGGDLQCKNTAQKVFDYFKEIFENDNIQEKYIKGFEE